MTAASTGTALVQVAQDVAGGELTIAKQKKFIELAVRTDLDKLNLPEQHAVLLAFGRSTGLRPELGEVMIYQGRFYVTIAGQRRNAHKNGLFDGRRSRPATPHERRNAGYEDGDIVWMTEVYRKGSSQPFVGWGKVTAAERKSANPHTPVAKHPSEIARKRSEYDALRAAFPLDEEISPFAAALIAEAEDEVAKPGTKSIGELPDPYAEVASVETVGQSEETTKEGEDDRDA